MNAELMDLLIDLFGEDNLVELERELNFIERIKWFSDRFYSKVNFTLKNKLFKRTIINVFYIKVQATGKETEDVQRA
jgi:hypothetical protein